MKRLLSKSLLLRLYNNNFIVIPAKAGIHFYRFRVKQEMTNEKTLLNILLLFLTAFYLLLFTFYLPPSVFALKQRVKPTATGNLSYSSVKLRPDRLAALVIFTNLSKVKEITYTLTYVGSGVEQGIRGSLIPAFSDTTQRDLLFGTCSKNVCRYHTGIQNMKLYVTTTTKTGKTTTKLYRIKP